MHHGFRPIWRLLLAAAALAAVAAAVPWYWPLVRFHAVALLDNHPDPPASTPEQRTPDHLRVLFIGNSFTFFHGGQALILKRLAESAYQARLPIADQVTDSGASLKFLWSQGKALARIREGHWDFVVLQEISVGTINAPAEFEQYTTLFDHEIRQVGARTVLFMTWCYKEKPEDQMVITAAYRQAAQKLHADLAPVGLAFAAVRRANPAFDLYQTDIDNKHPNACGSYLAGCVFYRLLYGCSAVGLRREIADGGETFIDLSPTDADFLQKIADQTVRPGTPDANSPGTAKTLNETPH